MESAIFQLHALRCCSKGEDFDPEPEPEDILEVITGQSNLYAIQCDPNKPLNLKIPELEQFFTIVLYLSLFELPATWINWNRAARMPQVAYTMSLNRWEAIKKMIHFSKNKNQQQGKDYPSYKWISVSHLATKFTEIPMVEMLTVYEQMVAFKRNKKLKVFLPSKPKKWGCKILVLA